MTDFVLKGRKQFEDLFNTTSRWAIVVAHRRCGKTVACIQKLIEAAMGCEKREPRYAYIAPLYKQAKDVAWGYLKHYAVALGAVPNESELRVDLPNGARIRLYGADNPDSLRGIYLDGVILDEYADMRPALWSGVIRPALSDRKGWAVFIGTPKGHNAFYELWQHAQSDDAWLALMLRASETGLIDEDERADARKTMSADQYEQEYECSFEAAIQGAYYAACITEARREGRIGKVARDPLMSVRAYWDIGGTGQNSDAKSIWISQFVSREIRVVDYYESVGQEISHPVQWLRDSGYEKAELILPHDGATKDRVFRVSYESVLREAGFSVRAVADKRQGAAMRRIEAARRLFPSIWIDDGRCKAGIEALVAYHEKWDEMRNVGLGPEHDWSSHGADAFGLMCVDYDAPGTVSLPQPDNRWVV